MLAFNPESALGTQLFLPELLHVITMLVGAGPLFMRQTVYGLLVNLIHSLASTVTSGEMDGAALQMLFKRVRSTEILECYGLAPHSDSSELSGGLQTREADGGGLADIENVTKLMGEVLEAGSVSVGKSCRQMSG